MRIDYYMRIQLNKNTFYFYISEEDITIFQEKIILLLQKRTHVITLTLSDKTILEIQKENENSLLEAKEKIIIYLDSDALEHCLYKLNEYIEHGSFSTPEFYELDDLRKPHKRNGHKQTIHSYFSITTPIH